MLSPEKAGLLQSFLGSLPEHVAARLAKAVEVDKLAGSGALPHALILDSLRPTLKRSAVKFERTPTPLRLFCQPFEDVLTSATSKEKRKGRIARAHILPVWAWLSQTLMPEAVKAYSEEFKHSVLNYKLDEANAIAQGFWRASADAIQTAMADEKGAKAAKAQLGSDMAIADAREMAILLAAGPEILEIQTKLQKYVPALTEELIWTIREVFDRVVARVPDSAPYIAVIVSNRLDRPWEAIRLPLHISRQTQDTLVSNTDMGLVGEVLLGEIEVYGATLTSIRHPNFDVEELLRALGKFAGLSSNLVKEIEMRRDGKWGQRLLKDRAAVSEIMNGLMERGPKEILAALPMQKSGFTGSSRVPDFSKPADDEKVERALRYVKLIIGSRPFASAASFHAKQKDAETEAMLYLRGYNEDLVKELRTPHSPRRDVAEKQFALAAEMTALLFSEEEAELMRRRARAALAA